ncbi:hypothetical protein ACWIUD_07615 [Helicobacter sp. 23-1044]
MQGGYSRGVDSANQSNLIKKSQNLARKTLDSANLNIPPSIAEGVRGWVKNKFHRI